MVVVEIEEEGDALLQSFENFVRYTFPGAARRVGNHLHLGLPGSVSPAVEARLVEKLVWAWRIERDVPPLVRVSVEAERSADLPHSS